MGLTTESALEIRNSNIEIRNNLQMLEIQMTKT
jgi:hypothetical protein